ncbi:hypothetical protein [Paenibacillus aceti]|uniref:DUF4825 domain-containing protein n=1 Tax=Paenibacillus aceti TaxID=1820010 RepID=A0ABQ1VWF7_9BACL|nr:hypothetical protein [Paenibacillus aceti]GGG02716.1 hypothetical protein GCM10010913_25560 [Paenibacillus aceti]
MNININNLVAKTTMLFLLTMSLTSCTSNNHQTTSSPIDSTSNSIVDIVTSPEKQDTTYKHEQLGFEITFPKSWDSSRYEIAEIENGIKVKYIPQNNLLEQATLFEIYVFGTKSEWDEWWEGGGKTEGVPFEKVGMVRENVFVIDGPTENIYKGLEEVDNEEYIRMIRSISDIEGSFKALDPSDSNYEPSNEISVDYEGIRE